MWHGQGRAEAPSWGVLLADVVRHLVNAIQAEHGTNKVDTMEQIVDSLLNELNKPTSEATGAFHPGHS
jgi:hypothetical protein